MDSGVEDDPERVTGASHCDYKKIILKAFILKTELDSNKRITSCDLVLPGALRSLEFWSGCHIEQCVWFFMCVFLVIYL